MRRVAEILESFEALPLVDIGTLLAGRRPLILAPHPDDESLGCGGLIAAACSAGLPPVVIILTDGSASHPGSKTWPPGRLAQLRKDETAAATSILGLPADNLYFFSESDSMLAASGEAFQQLVAAAARLAQIHDCRLIIGPWAGDPHCDHEAASSIAATLAANTGTALLSYPVWGWLREKTSAVDEPRTGGWQLDIMQHLPAKKRAIAAHASQYGDLITDSPQGFRLPKNLLEIFYRDFEVFIG